MKKIITVLTFLVFISTEIVFAQTVIFSENFESGTVNAAWGTYYKNEDKLAVKPMSQAPQPLTGGGNYVGWLQDLDGSYTGSAVAVAGALTLKDYSIEADVYCYYNPSPSGYTGLVVYADSSKKDFFKIRADFDASDRINLSGLKSDPATFLPLFNKDFKGTDNVGRYPKSNGWHKMKMEVRTISSTKVGFWVYFDNQLLTGCPIYYEPTNSTPNTSGSFGLYSFQQSASGIAAYFDNIVVTQLATGVEDNINLPTEYSLMQNYPNPFNPETQISYKLAANGFISLSIYDVLGREIKTLVAKEQQAGSYTVTWNGKNELGNTVPSGVYVYSLKTGNIVQSKKMILMK